MTTGFGIDPEDDDAERAEHHGQRPGSGRRAPGPARVGRLDVHALGDDAGSRRGRPRSGRRPGAPASRARARPPPRRRRASPRSRRRTGCRRARAGRAASPGPAAASAGPGPRSAAVVSEPSDARHRLDDEERAHVPEDVGDQIEEDHGRARTPTPPRSRPACSRCGRCRSRPAGAWCSAGAAP